MEKYKNKNTTKEYNNVVCKVQKTTWRLNLMLELICSVYLFRDVFHSAILQRLVLY